MDQQGYVALVYSLSAVVLVAFTSFAFIYGYLKRNKFNRNQEEFITAHRQVGFARIGWSLFAGNLGAYVISFFPSYAPFSGWIGLIFSALGQGSLVLTVCYAGEAIRTKVPHVQSLNDFVGWRYGWVAKTYVMLLGLLNMSTYMLAEYTVMASLFQVYVGTISWPMTIGVGLLTCAYTAYGGLIVSIVTDQVQGIAVVILFVMTAIYVAATFRHPLIGDPFPPGDCCSTPECLEVNPMGFCIAGTNKLGYSSIFSIPAATFVFGVFSESFWQRAWASRDRRALVGGTWLAFLGVFVICAFTGLLGLLGAWAGIIPPTTNINLYMFPAIKGSVNPETGMINNWIGVIIIVLTLIMNMSTIDSAQNGITAGISSHLLKGKPLKWTRLVVLIINIPIMILGARAVELNLSIVEVYVIAATMAMTTVLPVLMGVSTKLYHLLGGVSMMFSCVLSFILTSVYGVDYYYRNFDSIRLTAAFGCDCIAVSSPDAQVGMSEADLACLNDTCPTAKLQERNLNWGMRFTWALNNYAWDIFLVALCTSVGGMMLCAAFNWAFARLGRKPPGVPGFTAPATHPDMYPALEASDDSTGDKTGAGSVGSGTDLLTSKPESKEMLPGADVALHTQAPAVE